MLKLDRPIIFFDIETTGLNTATDFIVELAARRLAPYDGDFTIIDKSWLMKPREPIPSEIEELTGITNEMVKDEPAFHQYADEIEAFFDDADLAGYNVVRFDVPFLAKEFERVGKDLGISSRKILDVQKIYHKHEGRHLEDAVRFYAGREHDGAHRAAVDVRATVDVLMGQIAKYQWGPISIDELIIKQTPDADPFKVDSEGKLQWRNGEAVFAFGKSLGRSLKEVAQFDPSYLRWLCSPDRDFSDELKVIFRQALGKVFPKKEVAAQKP